LSITLRTKQLYLQSSIIPFEPHRVTVAIGISLVYNTEIAISVL